MQGQHDVGAEAMDWLAGRIRWEQILHALHERAIAEPSVGAVDDITVALDALTAKPVPEHDERAERAA